MFTADENPTQHTQDPVCGRELLLSQALLIAEYEGETYPFCCEHCRMLFSLHPERYAERVAETLTQG